MLVNQNAPSGPLGRTMRRSAAALACTALVLAACGDDDDDSSSTDTAAGGSEPAAAAGGESLSAVAQFYPLMFATERVGGDDVDVTNMTPAGAEPHDLELTPQDMTTLVDATIVVYLSNFAPAIDDAVGELDASQIFDAAEYARLDLEGGDHDHDHEDEDAHDHDDEEAHDHEDEDAHEDEEAHDHEDEDAHDHGGADPHFWLDPIRLADVADALAVQLGELDPEQAAAYTERAAALRTELEALDAEFAEGLAECESRELVTSHEAFGYLAERYDFTQVGIAGLSPNNEPSTAQLAEVTDFVNEHDVQTIYYETLVDPSIAETVAAETGASTAVLDPLEGLSDDSPGSDYFEVMRSNLEALREGQGCT